MSNLCRGKTTSPFGDLCLVWDEDGIHNIYFADQKGAVYASVNCRQADDEARVMLETLLRHPPADIGQFALIGTDFQREVWRALLAIPPGTVTTYQTIAETVGRPKAVRAVANAIAANPIAWLIPCHRVIRSDGGIGGYRWGLERKCAMLAWEQQKSRVAA